MESSSSYAMMAIASTFGKNNENTYLSMMIMVLIPLLSRFIYSNEMNDLIKKFKEFFDDDWIKLNIPTHEIDLLKSFCKIKGVKQVYSDNFLAICHHLKNKNLKCVKSLTELLTFETKLKTNRRYDDDYEEDESNKYIFIPFNTNKIKICQKRNIYCEFSNINSEKEDDDNSEKKDKSNTSSKKKCIITLMIKNNAQDNQMEILNEFLKECCRTYYDSIKPKDKNQRYAFEFRAAEKSDYHTHLYWDEYEYETDKDLLKNIHFEDKEDYLNYIQQFIYDPNEETNPYQESYKKCGFVYKAGILFHGSPGCGKTSVIKGTLKLTNRHAVIVDLSKIDSGTVLKQILNGRRFNNKTFKSRELCFIFEDCDAMNFEILKKRDLKEDEKKKDSDLKINNNMSLLEVTKLMTSSCSDENKLDEMNLSQLLQLLDGVIESPGIMYIFTTNHPEKIDDAILRPGRIDYIYEFKKCTKKIIESIIKTKFELHENVILNGLEQVPDYVLSPAEVQGICFKNNDFKTCLKKIILAAQKK
jgi:SpoVK/Ycf46/Vps4 family AAA+-type ATPase